MDQATGIMVVEIANTKAMIVNRMAKIKLIQIQVKIMRFQIKEI